MAPAEALLEARALTKEYPRYGGLLRRRVDTVHAVDQVSCSLSSADRLGLVGESGCGKTTLAKLLVGLVVPTSGEVLIQGRPLRSLRGTALLAARRRVQMIFQHPLNSLNPRLTVEEALSEPLQVHRLAKTARDRRKRIRELLASVRLPADYAKRLPRELSGGECQRVGIARALATSPDLLICDEPISSLDVSVGAKILELLRTISRERRMALLFISHDLGAVASVCERIAVMASGRWLEVGPTETILNRPSQPYTELLIRSAALDLDAA